MPNRECNGGWPKLEITPATSSTTSVNWSSVDLQVAYYGNHGTVNINGEELPIFLRGDLMLLLITVTYSGRVALDLPHSYASLLVWQVNKWNNVEIPASRWEKNPLFVSSPGQVEIIQEWLVPNLFPSGQVMQTEVRLYYNRQVGVKVVKCPIYIGHSHWFFGG